MADADILKAVITVRVHGSLENMETEDGGT